MPKLIESIGDSAGLAAHVGAILAQCSYDVHHVAGTTTTIAAIIHPNGHVLAVGQSATVFPEKFCHVTGADAAKAAALNKARDLLFESTSWQMRCERHVPMSE